MFFMYFTTVSILFLQNVKNKQTNKQTKKKHHAGLFGRHEDE